MDEPTKYSLNPSIAGDKRVLNVWRRRVRDGEVSQVVLDKIINDVKARIEETFNYHLIEVINGTGIILQTN